MSLLWLGCASGPTGCGALEPIPGGRYAGPKLDNGAGLRVTPSGFTALNRTSYQWIDAFAPGGHLDIPLPCSVTNVTLLGDIAVADEGSAGCTAESCGQLDGKCDAQDVPHVIPVTINGLTLEAGPPDQLLGNLNVSVDTGNLLFDSVSRNHYLCAFTSALKCSGRFNTLGNPPSNNVLQLAIRLAIDTRWDRLLTFELVGINGSQVCGGGAPAPPRCLDPNDLDIQQAGPCISCNAADVGLAKSFILGRLVASLQSAAAEKIAQFACEPCSAGAACPQLPSAQSQCSYDAGLGPDAGLCVDTTTGQCVPRLLGMENRWLAGVTLATAGASADAKLDFSVALGSSVSADGGLSVGARFGSWEVDAGACVPLRAPPADAVVPVPDFDVGAPAGYDLALTVSQLAAAQALHHTQQSGALCLELSHATVAELDSGKLRPMLPSLGTILGPDDAPLFLVVRPLEPPTVAVGEGTYDPTTQRPQDPLLRVGLKDLTFDIYALLDDRYARLFTLTADVDLPLSVMLEGCTDLVPAIGDLTEAVKNVRASNLEMLAESQTQVEALVPLLLAAAGPSLSSSGLRLTLPSFSGLKLKGLSMKGVGPVYGLGGYQHAAFYARLLRETDPCPTAIPPPRVRLEGTVERAAAGGAQLGVAVSSGSGDGAAQYAFRVDHGFWSPYVTARDGVVTVVHPSLALAGQHTVELKERSRQEPSRVSPVTEVRVVSDLEPPRIRLSAGGGQLAVDAHDAVTPVDRLEYAYRLGPGPWSAFGPLSGLAKLALDETDEVGVRVRDEAGRVGEARLRLPSTATR